MTTGRINQVSVHNQFPFPLCKGPGILWAAKIPNPKIDGVSLVLFSVTRKKSGDFFRNCPPHESAIDQKELLVSRWEYVSK